MLALRYHGNKDLRLEDIPDPSPGPGEVRVRCRYTSICATDIEEWQYGPLWVQYGSPNPLSGRSAPLVMGHEISGVIDSVGQGVDGWSAGERVVVNNVRTCGSCFWCTRSQQAVCPNMAVAGLSADGGLAEYMTWPADMIIRLPDSIPDEAAPLTEPAMVGVHAARRSGVKPGDTVCVLGCGTVGLMTVQAFAASGARVIAVDVRQQSLDKARDLSADVTIDAGANDVPEALLELTDGIGPDIVVETAGRGRNAGAGDRLVQTGRNGRIGRHLLCNAAGELQRHRRRGEDRDRIGGLLARRHEADGRPHCARQDQYGAARVVGNPAFPRA